MFYEGLSFQGVSDVSIATNSVRPQCLLQWTSSVHKMDEKS
jgi:hypothetical protein